MEPQPIDPLTGQPYITLTDALKTTQRLIVDPDKGPYLTIADALRAAVPGTSILLSAGVHIVQERNRFPDQVHLIGFEGWGKAHGKKPLRKSKIVNEFLGDGSGAASGIVPGSRAYFGCFDAENVNVEEANRTQALIGAKSNEGDSPFVSTRIERINAFGDTDLFYFLHSSIGSAWIERCNFNGCWDAVVIRKMPRQDPPPMHQFTFNHCYFAITGPSICQPNNLARAFYVDCGLTRIHNSALKASGADAGPLFPPGSNFGLFMETDLPEVHLQDTVLDAQFPYQKSPGAKLFINEQPV